MMSVSDEQGIAALVRDAHDANEPVWVHGRETKKGLMRPVQAARSVSTRGLSGITLYSPNEMIISAWAGTPVAEIEAALAEKGQHLIAEPPELSGLMGAGADQTIGGVVATNLSGPRRIAWGATRDHVMGVRFVNGMGELLHSGGRVLKNVTGLDICKLLTGSHGTLAVITEVTLKVLPVPERRATLVIAGLDPQQGVAAMSQALGSPYAVSGAAYLPAAAAALVPAVSWMGGAVRISRHRWCIAPIGCGRSWPGSAARSCWMTGRPGRCGTRCAMRGRCPTMGRCGGFRYGRRLGPRLRRR